MKTQWDYILAGGGCAGLSLVWHMLQNPELRHRQILILDSSPKTENDRTWCFWETGTGPFEKIVEQQWKNAWFHTPRFSQKLDLNPYSYKMIRSDRFYTTVKEWIASFPNVQFIQATIESMYSNEEEAFAKTDLGTFQGKWLFTSLPVQPNRKPDRHYLLQHFKGWTVKTENPIFDPDQPTLMDFRIDQHGDCRFMYVLPVSPNEALVEYTVFSAQVLEPEAYDSALREYINSTLSPGSYEVIHEEFGVIPMYSDPFPIPEGTRIIAIGTAGNRTKPSTGYTFTRIQKHSQEICQALITNRMDLLSPHVEFTRFQLYDNTLLHILANGNVPGARIFENLFRYNSPRSVLRFLDEDTTFLQEYRLLNTVPILKFIGPALIEFRKRFL